MLRQIALTAGTRVGLTIFGIATSVVTARFLGQAGRGEYFFIVTLAALIAQFANLGLTSSNTYFAARNPNRTKDLFANSLWISLAAGGGLGIAIALFAHVAGILQDTPARYLWLAAALAVPTLLYAFLSSILLGRSQVRAYNAVELGLRVILLPALVGAGFAGAGASGFITVSVVVWIAGCVAASALVRRHSPLSLMTNVELLVVGFRYATKAYLITLLAFVVLRGNVFLLRREFGPADLGLYSIAAQVGDVLAIVPQAVTLVLLPHLVRDTSLRWERTVRAAAWTAVAMAGICTAAALVAAPLIGFLYGSSFEPSARVLHIMLPSVFAVAVTAVFSQYLAAIGMPRPLLGVWAGGVAIMTVASLLLIPTRGAAGAAAALSAAHIATLVGVLVVAWTYRNAEPRGPRALASPTPADDAA